MKGFTGMLLVKFRVPTCSHSAFDTKNSQFLARNRFSKLFSLDPGPGQRNFKTVDCAPELLMRCVSRTSPNLGGT